MNNCGWALPTPETKTYSKPTLTRNVPIRRRDKNRRPRTCRADFLTLTHSKRSYTTTLPIRRRNTSRKAARKASVEARRLVPSDCAVWVRSWHTKDGGIMSEMSLSMRAPSVVPRYAVAVGSLKFMQRGNGDRENT